MADTVFELRRYTLKPGARDMLITIFDTHFVEAQEACGMTIVGQFRDTAAPDQFVWFRGFPGHDARTHALSAFYGGPVWAEHGPPANETMVEWRDVLMLRPAAPASVFRSDGIERLPPGTPDRGDGRDHLVAIHHLPTASSGDRSAVVATAAAEAARAAGGEVLASLISDHSPNGFARLPVREGECVAVTIARPGETGMAALEAALRAVAGDDGRAPDLARLTPTARSRLR